MTPFFFNPERGWSQDRDEALFCLQQSPGRNFFFRLVDGGWQAEDPENLSPIERGLLWKHFDEEERVRFQGLLEIDPTVEGLLAGLEPERINGKDFFLDRDQAAVFIERVKDLGGSLRQVSGRSPLLGRAEALLQRDIADLRAVESGDHSRIPQFRERGPLFQNLLEQALASGEEPEPFHEAIRARAGAEKQIERLIQMSKNETPPLRPETRLLDLRDLDWILSAEGFQCSWQGDELILSLPGGQVVLGPAPRVVTD